jgi:shikimate kinase
LTSDALPQPGLPPSHREPIERVVLVGFMAAGKSAVGAELARRLGWRHLDLDQLIEAAAGCSVAEIFAREGEARFRVREAEATAALAGSRELVLTPGGGWMADARNAALLGPGSLVVWLRVSVERALERAAAAPGQRPLLRAADPLEAARRLLEERTPHYRRAALEVDTEGRTVAAVAALIATEVRARTARSDPGGTA